MKKICGTNIYRCDHCDFETNKKSKWERHLSTQKHKNNMNENKIISVINKNVQQSYKIKETNNLNTTTTTNTSSGFICECGKKYSYRQSFIRHQDTCSFVLNVEMKKDVIDTEINNEKKVNSWVYSLGLCAWGLNCRPSNVSDASASQAVKEPKLEKPAKGEPIVFKWSSVSDFYRVALLCVQVSPIHSAC